MSSGFKINRRRALWTLASSVSGMSLHGLLAGCGDRLDHAAGDATARSSGLALRGDDAKPRFLIVLTCSGGASILDSFMALSEAEVRTAGGDPRRLNCFGDAQLVAVDNTPFKAVKVEHSIATLGGYRIATDQSAFLRKHMRDMLVVTTEGTSVNHGVAQKRSITGNDAWRGRTLQECVALSYGANMPLANLSMGSGGFASPGIDADLPEFARQVDVSDPVYWALGLHSHLGLPGMPKPELLEIARRVRDQDLEPNSNFLKTFRGSAELKRWFTQRGEGRRQIEEADLIRKLWFLPGDRNGLRPTAEAERLRELFPDYAKDSLDAQAIMAYLAITRQVSCTVTLGPTPAALSDGLQKFYNPPIAFDFSHTDHRGTQAMMWERVLKVADRLIDLLKAMPFDESTGESFWDRTMIYFASDFGRDKLRPADAQSFTSGHHLNNASLIVSPLVAGNRILGGLDAAQGLTYGFDLSSGAPAPGRKTSEAELFAGIVQAMGVDTTGSGLPDVRAMRRA